MTKIKFCGLTRPCDIEAVNELKPEYIGFVFWQKSKRYVSPDKARELKSMLSGDINAVGVFVDEQPSYIAGLLNENIIDIAQLHGGEDEEYINSLKELTDKPVIKAFRISTVDDIKKAEKSSADYVLLDAGMGEGRRFDWSLIERINRPYFLAGGLDCGNVADALGELEPFAVDVSSGIETDGVKDASKMREFVSIVRN